MGTTDGTHTPYYNEFEPLLAVDDTVELQPSADVYVVDVVELLPTITTQEFTVPANGTLETQEVSELYAKDGSLQQLRLVDPVGGANNPFPEGIEISIDQGGQQSPRFNTKNQRGVIDANTAETGDNYQFTELFQFEDTDLYFTIENTTGAEETFEIPFAGFAFDLTRTNMEGGEADATVPVERVPFADR